MAKLDFTDTSKEFSDTELQYASLLVDGIDLSESELVTKFGADKLRELKSSIAIRRYVVEEKIKIQNRKVLSNKIKVEEILKGVPLGIRTLIDLAQNAKAESVRCQAAIQLAKPAMSYLDSLLKSLGVKQSGVAEDEQSEENKSLNIYFTN